ncbi:hypothetical protein [Hyphomicrobium facile]|uniref:Uncharacterized protein n=1 Tax=Hyphomicrobium facile TaxID=51670 RepID=A0A1I7NH54_9HYPH|nr:hypothetical protein [Hyphomicrobium facile]SFV33991.1 hypothetical protein SAMN04488557_2178 [Hyphomicrobium facile]
MASKPTVLEHRALSLMRARFDAQCHYPSQDQQDALADIIMCLERMRTGRAANKVFLSAVDPGIGKTSALSAYLSVYLEDISNPTPVRKIGSEGDAEGILICINSWREIEDLLVTLKPHLSEVFVRVPKGRIFGDSKMREAYSMRNPNNPEDRPFIIEASELAKDGDAAAVFIATHEYISQTIERYGSAQTAKPLFFHGRPRSVRVWDEAWVPAEPITISCRQVHEILNPLSQMSEEVYKTLSAFITEAEKREDRECMMFPDLVARGVTYETIDAYLDRTQASHSTGEVERKRALLYACIMASGKHVSVCNEYGYGNTVLTFTDSSPYAMTPLLVLDASGRVRKLYHDLVSRRVVKLLRTASKDYSQLKVHLWGRSAGRGGYNPLKSTDYLEVAEEVVKLIQSKPGERFLILHYKAKDHPTHPVVDFREVVQEKLPAEDHCRVRFLTWGKHRATNEFAEFENIVIFGLLNLRKSTLSALQRIGMGVRPEDGEVASIAEFRLGEHNHNLLQAMCRIRVRKAQGNRCPQASAYIIAHPSSGIGKLLPEVFPGIPKVEAWGKQADREIALSPIQKKVYDHLHDWAKRDPGGQAIRYAKVMKAFGISDGSYFKRAVRLSAEFNAALEQIGIHEDRSRGKNTTAWSIFDRSLIPQPTFQDFGFTVEKAA